MVMALNLPGVNVMREYRRYYPAGEVAGHLVGFTSVDDDGQEGLELAFNHWLSGESGAKRVLKDRLGRSVENVASIRPPRHGKDLRTSIDLRLQYLSYRTLKAAIQQYKAESGSIVILDIVTGEVLAMVNQPTYNPNDRAQYSAERYRNRAITDIFEPGSSIKPLILAAALDSGRYRASSIVDTAPGYVVVGPKKIEDPRNLGRISLATILSRSSNVGATKIAMSLEPDQLWDTMTRFGLGSLTASGFPGESAGLLTHYNDWRQISQATLGYGYGVSVTPLQLAQAYAAIGSGGVIRPVSLVRLDEAATGKRIVDREIAMSIRSMMEPATMRVSPATGWLARPELRGNLPRAVTRKTNTFQFLRDWFQPAIRVSRPLSSSMSRVETCITAVRLRRRFLRTSWPNRCACSQFLLMRCLPTAPLDGYRQ
jgi:cell division protein FtsI (penicillin-binding protein 3)